MARIFQLRRGAEASIPTLAAGEIVWASDTNNIWVGTDGSGGKQIIGSVKVAASLPTVGIAGRIVLNTGDGFTYIDDGSAWQKLGITDLSDMSGVINDDQHGDRSGGSLHAAATTSVNGFMSSTDKTKLDASTNLNTASALVLRDASGNFSAGTISADLVGDVTGNADTATTLATSRNITLTGDASGSASFNGSADASITVVVADDSHNHIISNVDGLQTVLDLKAPLASPSLSGVPTAPTAAAGTTTTQIATTAFVGTAIDNLSTGIAWKAPVVAATTGAGTLATDFEAGDALDDITLVAGDRILIKDQASGAENGIYIVQATGAPIRATDADNSPVGELDAAAVFVMGGTVNAEAAFVQTADVNTIETDPVIFAQFSGAGQINAGDGLAKSGNTLSVNVDGSGIEISADTLQLKADGVKDSHIDWGTGAGQVSAEDMPIADTGTLFATDNVEAALSEVMTDLNAVEDNGISAGTGIVTSGTIGADNLSVSLDTLTDSGTGSNFVKITRDSYGRISGTTAVAKSDISGLLDDNNDLITNLNADLLDGQEGSYYSGLVSTLQSDLASTANGDGASLIGIEDSGALITATTVEGALVENRTAIDAIEDNTITSPNGSLSVAGTVGADNQTVDVVFSTAGAANRSIQASDLASTSTGLGASLVGIESFTNMTATDVQGALEELQGDINTLNSASAFSIIHADSGTDVAPDQVGDTLTITGGDGIATDTGDGTADTLTIAVTVGDFAGTGLENDGANNLRIAAGAAGNGLVGGAGSALAVGAGSGITVNADDVAINLAANSGLNTTSGLALDASSAGDALSLTAGVYDVLVDSNSIVINGSSQLEVGNVDCGSW